MKINYQPQSILFSFRSLFGLLTVLFGLLPASAFALSGESQELFSAASTSNWVVTSGGNGYALHLSSAAPTDNADANSAQYAELYSSTATTTGVTVTYTDPSPTGSQNDIQIDLMDDLGISVEIIVTDTMGNAVTAQYGSNDIITSCFFSGSNPTGMTTTDSNWDTAFVDTSSLTHFVQTVQLIFQDTGQMSPGSGYVALDYLRGQPLESCYTATYTPTPGATNTSTETQSPTYTATSTATNTQTVTNTSTPYVTSTSTSSMTVTNTPGITNTQTMTATSTPGACQPYVYPNPMDFTVNHNLAYFPPGICSGGNGKCIVFNCVPVGATLKIYTVSLALVRTFDSTAIQTNGADGLPSGTGMIAWDGTTNGTSYVSAGLYFYTINSAGTNTFGKFAISKSIHGP